MRSGCNICETVRPNVNARTHGSRLNNHGTRNGQSSSGGARPKERGLPWQVEPSGHIHLPPSQPLSSTRYTARNTATEDQEEQTLGQILQEIEREENYNDMMAAAEAAMVGQPHVSKPRYTPEPLPRKTISMKTLTQDPRAQNLDNTLDKVMERPPRKASPPVWWETDGDNIKMTAPPAWLAAESERSKARTAPTSPTRHPRPDSPMSNPDETMETTITHTAPWHAPSGRGATRGRGTMLRDRIQREHQLQGMDRWRAEAQRRHNQEQKNEDLDKSIFTTEPSDTCLLYTSPSPRDLSTSRMPSSA